jgi:vacuolar-type H+-ATPase subunit C/Vma6
MAGTGELAYIYAKASGILAKSFIGPRVKLLAGRQRVAELYSKVLPGETPPQVPERELVTALQRRVVERTIEIYQMVIDAYGGKERILVQLLKSFDFLNVKELLYSMNTKEAAPPRLIDLGKYAEVRTKGYPDPRRLFEATRFSWLVKRHDLSDVAAVENELDKQYYVELWEIARRLPRRDKGIKDLVRMEAIYENIVWAVRLRVYYGLEEKEIAARLIGFQGTDVASPALESCSFPLDSREKWALWRYGYLVNEEGGEAGFRPDPRVIEARAARRLYALTRRLFHGSPFSLTPSVCFFKLKEFEADIVKSVAEGMQMNLPDGEILAFLGEIV